MPASMNFSKASSMSFWEVSSSIQEVATREGRTDKAEECDVADVGVERVDGGQGFREDARTSDETGENPSTDGTAHLMRNSRTRRRRRSVGPLEGVDFGVKESVIGFDSDEAIHARFRYRDGGFVGGLVEVPSGAD